jgi:hypothetical protein
MASKNRPKKFVINLSKLSKKASPGFAINIGIKENQLGIHCCILKMVTPRVAAARLSRSRPKG